MSNNNKALLQHARFKAYRLCNDKARLKYALEMTLSRIGVGDDQIDRVICDVRNADFDRLLKTIRIEK